MCVCIKAKGFSLYHLSPLLWNEDQSLSLSASSFFEWISKYVLVGKVGVRENMYNCDAFPALTKMCFKLAENIFTFLNYNCQCLCKFFTNLNFSFEYFPCLVFALPFIILLQRLNLSTDNILPQNCCAEVDWLSLHKYHLQIRFFDCPPMEGTELDLAINVIE